MKDATLATRTERAVAHLEALLVRLELICGRLERFTAFAEGNLPPAAPSSQPPFDPQARELAEKVIQRQIEEQREAATG